MIDGVYMNNKLIKSFTFSILAQIVSLGVSFLLNFIVPKVIDEYQYSYWQTYVLYSAYVGLFQFGLLEGLVLRYAAYDFSQLNKENMRAQFNFLCILIAFFSIIGIISGVILFRNSPYFFVIICVSIAIFSKNIFCYTHYSFQMTNRIKLYAICIILQKVLYGIIVIFLLCFKVGNFYWYCFADIFGDIGTIFISFFFNRGIYIGKLPNAKVYVQEIKKSISGGFIILIAGYASTLLVNGAKMVIQWRWGELVFGQVSFSFSVSNVFLTFITATSVVLFPSLKRMNDDELPDLYTKIRGAISPLLFFAMILYFPGCWILEIWLPNYTSSLVYLGILLPIIIFSSKVSLLTNNYLKAYRKEKLMLVINVASVIIGIILFALGAYAFNNLDFILYSLVAVIMLRSVASEIAVTKIIKKNISIDFIIELAMTVIFVVVVQFLLRWWACLAYACALIVYAIIYRKNIATLFRMVMNMIRHKKKQDASASERKP